MAHPSPTRRRILVRTPNWIGDQVMAYPFFHRLREAFPDAHLAAFCVPWVEHIQFRNLVDEVIAVPVPLHRSLWEKWTSLEAAGHVARMRGPWDIAISLPNSLTAAWQIFRSGAADRWGYAGDGRRWLLTRRVPNDGQTRHRSDTFMQILPEALRSDTPAADFWQPVAGRSRRFPVDDAWGGFPVLPVPEEPFWILAPGSVADSRRWPVERFAEVARLIFAETGWRGVVVGGDSDAVLAQKLCAEPTLGLIDCTARGPVPVLRRHFEQALFTLANDSGLAHVAALCGSPVQVVWGAGNPRHTMPLGPGRVQVISTPIGCWPCERNTCQRTDGPAYECLDAITPEAVWRQIHDGLLPTLVAQRPSRDRLP